MNTHGGSFTARRVSDVDEDEAEREGWVTDNIVVNGRELTIIFPDAQPTDTRDPETTRRS